MWIRSGHHSVLASPQGGSVLQWQHKDYLILGPAQVNWVGGGALKKRGETHWCYPNFGTPPDHHLHVGKHGWLRERLMRVVPPDDEKGDKAEFEFLGKHNQEIRSKIEVDYSGLLMRLEVTTVEDAPILPALHPYFATPESGKFLVFIGEDRFEKDDFFSKAQVHEVKSRIVRVWLDGVGHVQINTTRNCTHVVLWSDDVTKYFCVEPVFGTPGTFSMPEGQRLGVGEKWIGEVGFQFRE